LHQVFNKFKAILNILTIYKQASSKSSACSNIKSYIFFKKRLIFSFTFTYEWYFIVGEIAPRGRFCDLPDLGAISAFRGRFLQVRIY